MLSPMIIVDASFFQFSVICKINNFDVVFPFFRVKALFGFFLALATLGKND